MPLLRLARPRGANTGAIIIWPRAGRASEGKSHGAAVPELHKRRWKTGQELGKRCPVTLELGRGGYFLKVRKCKASLLHRTAIMGRGRTRRVRTRAQEEDSAVAVEGLR